MVRTWCLLLVGVLLGLLDPGNGLVCLSQDLSGAARVRADLIIVPDLLGSVSVDAALGSGSISLAGGVDVLVGPSWSMEARGALSLRRDWLSLTAAVAFAQRDVSIAAVATPGPWWVHDGLPLVWVDLQAGAGVLWTQAAAQPIMHVTLAPRVQSLVALWNVVFTPSIRYDIRLGTDVVGPRIEGVVLSSTAGHEDATGTVSVHLGGFFERISSVRGTINWTHLGVTVTGSAWRTESGQRMYDAGVVLEWGDLSRLPAPADVSGSTCVGDVCY